MRERAAREAGCREVTRAYSPTAPSGAPRSDAAPHSAVRQRPRCLNSPWRAVGSLREVVADTNVLASAPVRRVCAREFGLGRESRAAGSLDPAGWRRAGGAAGFLAARTADRGRHLAHHGEHDSFDGRRERGGMPVVTPTVHWIISALLRIGATSLGDGGTRTATHQQRLVADRTHNDLSPIRGQQPGLGLSAGCGRHVLTGGAPPRRPPR